MSRGSTAELQGLDATHQSEPNSTTLSPVSPSNKLRSEKQVEDKAKDEVEEIERLEERVEGWKGSSHEKKQMGQCH